jgi:hypothetical protein
MSSWLRLRQPLDRCRSGVGAVTRGPTRVIRIEWDPDTDTLTGSVVGHGALYDTAAFFTSLSPIPQSDASAPDLATKRETTDPPRSRPYRDSTVKGSAAPSAW